MSRSGRDYAARDLAPDVVPAPRRVPLDAPWEWLAAGWRDIGRMPSISLAYGVAALAGAGALLLGLMRFELGSLFLALAGGFLLIGPILAVGLYEASRRSAEGTEPRLGDVAWAWLGAEGQLGFFGVILMLAFMVWLQLAFLLLMLFLGGSGLPPPTEFISRLLFTPGGLGLLVVGTCVGGLLAAFIFAISALAVPLLLVKRTDAVTAGRISLAAVVLNLRPMALWAGLIVVLMVAGFATLLLGLVVAFPLVGHATWHAYEDILGDRRPLEPGAEP